MGGEDKHLGYLHMGGGVGGIDGRIGDIVTGKRRDALVDVGGALGITVEAGVTEVGLHQTGLEVGDTDGSIGDIETQAVGDGLHGSLGGAVNIAIGIGGVASHRADIDDMATVALHHAGNHKTGHGQQTLDIGVDHSIPVVVAAFVFGLKAEGEAGIVHKHVNIFPFGGQGLYALCRFLAVAHIEDEGQHIGTFGGKLLTDFLKALLVASSENETVAIGGEFSCATEANATRGACYQYYLVHLFYCYVLLKITQICGHYCTAHIIIARRTTLLPTTMSTLHINDIKAIAKQAHDSITVREGLFAAMHGDDRDEAVHSAWALTHLPKTDTPHIAKHREELTCLAITTPDTSLRRITLALLERLDWTMDDIDDVPRYYVDLLDFSMEHMMMPDEPYGVRSLCMKIAYTLSLPYPELLEELRQSLLLIEPTELGAGVRHTRNKILKSL